MATSLEIRQRSASTATPPSVRRDMEVAKLIDVSKCIGCKACQVACMAWNDVLPEVGATAGTYDNPADLGPAAWTVMRYAEHEENGRLEWLIRKDGCMHCADPGCLKACPAPGAIVQYANGIVDFVQDNCIGCGYCVKGCPFDIPRISQTDDRAYKCSLCSDRVAVGQSPACAKACPTGAIVFGAKDNMIQHAEGRIADLRSRGYRNAGLYDPPGVGGTHVMYVLHHADRPGLYSDLPHDPSISPAVALWKGALKPLSMIGMGMALLAGVFHFVTRGPNEVTEADEEAARKLTGKDAS